MDKSKDNNISSRGITRYKDKINHLSYLFSRFGYTTRPIFTLMLGLGKRSQERFFLTLIDRKMVREFDFIEHEFPLILPRKKFVDLIQEELPESKIPTTAPSKISDRLIRHTLFSQLIIIKEGGLSIEYITDRMMLDGRSKRPDMIIGEDHAIEAELTYKGKNKTVEAFLNLLMEIKEGHYSKVTYYTPSPYIYKHLKETFEQDQWAIPQKKGRPIMRQIPKDLKDKFEFKLLTK